jgi:hypothetical protein
MNHLKKTLSNELTRLKNVKVGSDLYLIYFRVSQLWIAVSLFNFTLIFGLYTLLNPSVQKKFLNDAAPWVLSILSACRVNFVEKTD